ncbi:hypothetical protein GCM10010428_27700 [Actinosynnema pretiosum subsp. pretiosum]
MSDPCGALIGHPARAHFRTTPAGPRQGLRGRSRAGSTFGKVDLSDRGRVLGQLVPRAPCADLRSCAGGPPPGSPGGPSGAGRSGFRSSGNPLLTSGITNLT